MSPWQAENASQNALWYLHPKTMGLWYESSYYISMLKPNECALKIHMKMQLRRVQCAFWGHIQHAFQIMH